jgi:predicted nucleotidyltransferase
MISWSPMDARETGDLVSALKGALESDPRIAYALLFGSTARGHGQERSDIDVAVSLRPARSASAREIGELVSRLESATGREVDLVVVEEAPPALCWRIFREGVPLFVADRAAIVRAKARAILDYLDFRPIEEICTRGVLRAAKRGR